MSRPPSRVEWLLGRLLPADRREEILGDLSEAYERRSRRRRTGALLWYAWQVVAVPARLLFDGVGGQGWELRELRQTGRSLVRSPAFTVVAVLSLGLGIGATTAIVGTARALLYTTLSVDRPDELRLLFHERPDVTGVTAYASTTVGDPVSGASVHSNYSMPGYLALDAAAGPAVRVAAYTVTRQASIVVPGSPPIAGGVSLVSGDYFETLGLGMQLGRPLTDADDRPGAPRVAVIGHGLWSRAFRLDPAVLGRTIALNGEAFEIVGVTPRGWRGLSPSGLTLETDVTAALASHEVVYVGWAPASVSLGTARDRHWIRLIARAADEAALAGATDAMTSALQSEFLEAGLATAEHVGRVRLRSLSGARGLDGLERRAERPLAILSAVAGLVLLIACANLATLLLARGASRQQELAVRRAIGAGRWQLVRPVLLEAFLLAAVGGVLGLYVAVWGGPLLAAALLGRSPQSLGDVVVDGRLLTIAAAAVAIATLLSGLMPAARMLRVDPAGQLKERTHASAGGRFWLGRGLIVAQIAISVPVVVAAGLFVRTLGNLGRVDPGFDADGLVVFQLDPSLASIARSARSAMYERVHEELRGLSGVGGVAVVENGLLTGWRSNTGVTIDGEETAMYMNAVSPGFFAALGVALVAGRDIEPSDDAAAPGVVLVNETAERELFGGRALGRHFRIGDRDVEVVGVVGDTKYWDLRDDVEPTFFDPYAQRPGGLFAVHFMLRSDRPVAALDKEIRDIVARVDPRLPILDVRSQGDAIRAQVVRERVFARLLSAFGGFALLLACVGLHGVTAFAVSRRTLEMGVRLALGARPLGLVQMVLGQVLLLAVLGLLIGVPAAYLLAPVVGSFLYGVAPGDPLTIAGAAVGLTLVALLAGWVPAHRASCIDPRAALSPPGGG